MDGMGTASFNDGIHTLAKGELLNTAAVSNLQTPMDNTRWNMKKNWLFGVYNVGPGNSLWPFWDD